MRLLEGFVRLILGVVLIILAAGLVSCGQSAF